MDHHVLHMVLREYNHWSPLQKPQIECLEVNGIPRYTTILWIKHTNFIYSVWPSPTNIHSNVDRTHDLHIFSLTLSQQRCRGNNIVDGAHYPFPTKTQRQQHCGWNTLPSSNRDTKATALWIEHTTFIYFVWLIFSNGHILKQLGEIASYKKF
jgi:hypothetical protein